MSDSKEFQSSISVSGSFPSPKKKQMSVPTFGLVIFLLICFFVLKKFIYIKDDKRHDK